MRAQPRRRVRRDHGGRPAPRRRTRRGTDRPAPVALRSVTLSVPDLARSEAFFGHGLGLPRSDAALRAPEHEALWGLAGARTRSGVFDAGSVLVELVQYLDPIGRPRPPGHRISDQGILNVAFGARRRRDHRELYRRARAAGAQANRRPLQCPGAGVVYVNDPDDFSVELLWMSERSEKHWGFTPRPVAERPRADTHAIERTIRIAAPAQATWDVIADHERMSRMDRPRLRPAHRRRRTGSRRSRLRTAAEASRRQCHRAGGELPAAVLVPLPRDQGLSVRLPPGRDRLRAGRDHTELTWTIRFRPKLPGTGRPLAALLSRLLGRVLRTGLKPYIETRTT